MTRPSGRYPRRRHVKRETRRIFRILTEGEVTEPRYLTEWARLNRHKVFVEITDRGMTPDALVRRAQEHARAGRPRRRDPAFDEIWCVFDVDQHPNVPQAVHNAGQSGIEVAVSNPCIELWLVLHARHQTAWISRRDIQQRSHELGLTSGKRIPETAWMTLIDDFETAKHRARELDARHEGNGSPRRTNPSTDVWRLVDRLRYGLDTAPVP